MKKFWAVCRGPLKSSPDIRRTMRPTSASALRVLAGEVYSLTAAMDWLEQQFFAQTAQDEQLDLRAQEHGIQRAASAGSCGRTHLFPRQAALVPRGDRQRDRVRSAG